MAKRTPPNQITDITRRDIVDELLLRPGPFYGSLNLMEFLSRVWNLTEMPSTDSRCTSAYGDIATHMVSFKDWTESELLYNRLAFFIDLLRLIIKITNIDKLTHIFTTSMTITVTVNIRLKRRSHITLLDLSPTKLVVDSIIIISC